VFNDATSPPSPGRASLERSTAPDRRVGPVKAQRYGPELLRLVGAE
jgi:hypothetical protein